MTKYVIPEVAGDCEWDTFTSGTLCDNPALWAIVEPDVAVEPPIPFHEAHLCDTHIEGGFAMAIQGESEDIE